MNSVAANQHFAVHEHAVLHGGLLQQTSAASAIKLPADHPRTAGTTIPNNIAQVRQTSATTELSELTPKQKPEQKSSADALAESTTSPAQNEDKQSFNQLQTVDAVERILDQLSTGKLLSWIDGNSMEKIQAQLTEQQRASAVVKDLPALSAQSIATSFGLDDGEALLSRIARSGIFMGGQNSAMAFDHERELHQVDLNV